ncbi:MAG: NAD-dependent epimerase/dehydratase family protein [Bacteroidales bacterium]|nr:NAD-dependent epimerase/dehydratase family protein [Bacteroidales bacterium]
MTKFAILEDDFLSIKKSFDFSLLKNSSVFVTGATGLLGSQILLFLDYLNRMEIFSIRLFGLIRNEEKAKKVFGERFENITFIIGDVLKLPEIPQQIDYIIHGASVTSSLDFVSKPVETIDIAINGTLNILRFAKSKNVKSMVYLSSMEVFGITPPEKTSVSENDYGYIDILSCRSSYSESKRLCECLCHSFAKEFSLPVKIARLTQTLSAGIDYNDTRVAAQFARAVIEGHNIVLKTTGATKRPVIYTSDAISAVLTMLLKGTDGQAYTAANEDTFFTIRETAEMIVTEIAKDKIKLVFDIKDVPAEYAPNLNLNLNTGLLRSLGWSAKVGLKEAYERMIKGMEE